MPTRLKIILLASLLIIIGFFGFYLYHQKTNDAWAVADDESNASPLQGWAWTDTTGWISFNCRDTKLCNGGGDDYDRHFCADGGDCNGGTCEDGCGLNDEYKYVVSVKSDGTLQGHAWSENVGWVRFTAPTRDDRDPANCPETGNLFCHAYYEKGANNTDGKIKGWAKVLSLINSGDKYDTGETKSYGWVKLDESIANIQYGISVEAISPDDGKDGYYDDAWGDLSGWAWGGAWDGSNIPESNGMGLGWFSFNCENDNCLISDYKVTAQPDRPTITSVTPLKDKDDFGNSISWTNVYGAINYQVLREDYFCTIQKELKDVRCAVGREEMCDEDEDDNEYGDCKKIATSSKAINLASTATNFEDTDNISYGTYRYIIRAYNLLGGIASNPSPVYTPSPISMNNMSVIGTCSAGSSEIKVDLFWTSYISFAEGNQVIEKYEIEYCVVDANGACSAGYSPADIIDATIPADGDEAWSHIITDNPLYSLLKNDRKYIIYRVRAIGNAPKRCQGGTKDDNNCVNDNDCGGSKCDLEKSGWLYSGAKQICPYVGQYKEVRPAK